MLNQQILFPESTPEELYSAGAISESELFTKMFDEESLRDLFVSEFFRSTSKGVDRINGFQFNPRSVEQFEIASRKCIDGTYRFSAYLEVLKLKGRSKVPRLIGIPTIRDRVILRQMNKFIATIFPESVPKNIAAAFVRLIAEDLPYKNQEDTYICSTDIKTFYDSIQRARLIKILSKKIKNTAAMSLIKHALSTPIVPKNARRKTHSEYHSEKGVPQGLAISNILAAIYMHEVDSEMRKLNVTYYRYVDDVIIYGSHDPVHQAYISLKNRLSRRGLSLHTLGSGKTQIKPLSQPFGYLGYYFSPEKISVRDSTIERFIQSIATKFSEFIHNKTKRLEKFKYLNEDRLKEIFLLELNEKITGAISEDRRYGWIAYFNQITDLTLLYKIDVLIRNLFKRLPEFNRSAPSNLKKISRAYWEIRHNPSGGYIHNYDEIITREQKLVFLQQRGRLADDEKLTDAEVDERYEKYRRRVLSAMHGDEGRVY